jgi:cytochrome c553
LRRTRSRPTSFRSAIVLVFGSLAAFAGAPTAIADPPEPPAWAYPLNPASAPKPATDDGVVMRVPGGEVGLTRAQILDRFTAVDWRPGSHPLMAPPVAQGRKPDLYACGYCHYPNGQGRPENAALAGLPAAYMVGQVAAMRDGSRKSSQPAMVAPRLMLKMAAHADADEVAAAAAYYSALPYKPWIKVVEAYTVPRPVIHGVSAYGAAADGSREPIGDRIVELPEDEARTDLRDDASGFVAYVPPGAVETGRLLAETAEGERQPCAACHGADFKGGMGPPIAGRSHLFRQLFDVASGARSGPALEKMKIEVAALNQAQMRDLVAYVASLPP